MELSLRASYVAHIEDKFLWINSEFVSVSYPRSPAWKQAALLVCFSIQHCGLYIEVAQKQLLFSENLYSINNRIRLPRNSYQRTICKAYKNKYVSNG